MAEQKGPWTQAKAEQERAAAQTRLDIEGCHVEAIHQARLQAVRKKAPTSRATDPSPDGEPHLNPEKSTVISSFLGFSGSCLYQDERTKQARP